MATVSTRQTLDGNDARECSLRRLSKRQLAPAGTECPHCLQRNRIFFSSAHQQKPLHKRAIFAYLRCHSCTHRFRTWRFGPALVTLSTIATVVLIGLMA